MQISVPLGLNTAIGKAKWDENNIHLNKNKRIARLDLGNELMKSANFRVTQFSVVWCLVVAQFLVYLRFCSDSVNILYVFHIIFSLFCGQYQKKDFM